MKSDHLYGAMLEHPDVVLIGGGIMSATLGLFLRRLNPDCTIQIIEALPQVASESSNAWNNAGTGHAALCELNYTPQSADGVVDISKAARINEQFETSKHFWGWLVEQGILKDPQRFIRSCPHMSFVWGQDNMEFLKKRHEAMSRSHFFKEMEFSTDLSTIGTWAPLLLEGRTGNEPLAATREPNGTDVNYGALTMELIDYLKSLEGVELALQTQVKNLSRNGRRWKVRLNNGKTLDAGLVFIGAGGGALPLLQKSGIPEGKGFGGFPVSGQFLVCNDPTIVEKHGAKVYGKAAVGAPPMSVPHLDTRVINGRKSLLFGPYAGFSPKYLKSGSNLDLFKSVKPDNLGPMLAAGRDNMPLTHYLINQCRQTHADRCNSLREYFPAAKDDDWKLITAGQRVQIIKRDAERTGKLQFGTEVVASADGSLSTVLGASPGASTAVAIILQVLEKCFPQEMGSSDWKKQLAEMVPAYGVNLAEEVESHADFGAKARQRLKL